MGAAWAVPAVTVAAGAPAFAASPSSGLSGGLCSTAQSGTTVNNANIYLYFFAGTESAVPARGATWTNYVTVTFANNTDYNAFTNPWKASWGGFTGSVELCASNATTRTRTYKVTYTNSTALPAGYKSCAPYIYTGDNTGVKPTTQITVVSKESGTTQNVVYNAPNSIWGCTPSYQGTPTSPPASGCCNYGSSGRRNTTYPCGRGVNGCA